MSEETQAIAIVIDTAGLVLMWLRLSKLETYSKRDFRRFKEIEEQAAPQPKGKRESRAKSKSEKSKTAKKG